MQSEPDSRTPVLASDAERERVALLLRDAAGEGRLTLEELSERLGWVYGSRTTTELEVVTRDLPTPSPALAISSQAPARAGRSSLVMAVMSGAKRRGRWRPGKRCVALAVMGGCRLDLRDAEIPGRRLDIIAVSVMGGVRIVVPEGVQVDVDGIAVMGGKRVDVADVPAHPGTPVIHVHVVTVMGGVKVVSRPPRELKPPTG